MDCTIATLVACFSWANLYIDTGLSWQDRGDSSNITQMEYFEHTLPSGVIESGTTPVTRRVGAANNPYGKFSLGYLINLGEVSLTIEAAHRSSLDTSRDRGTNYLEISARWFPFR